MKIIHIDGSTINILDCPDHGTHGKFYEKSFLNKYDIYYDDVNHDEDTNITTKVQCVLASHNLISHKLRLLTYNWVQHEGSLSDQEHKNGYWFNSIPDYMRSIFEVSLNYYEKMKKENHMTDELYKFFKDNILFMFFRLYFDMLEASYPKNNCPPIPQEYYDLLKSYFVRFKQYFNMSTQDFLNYIYDSPEIIREFSLYRTEAFNFMPFIETITFHDWVYKYLD